MDELIIELSKIIGEQIDSEAIMDLIRIAIGKEVNNKINGLIISLIVLAILNVGQIFFSFFMNNKTNKYIFGLQNKSIIIEKSIHLSEQIYSELDFLRNSLVSEFSKKDMKKRVLRVRLISSKKAILLPPSLIKVINNFCDYLDETIEDVQGRNIDAEKKLRKNFRREFSNLL